jgi:hypothetical protein
MSVQYERQQKTVEATLNVTYFFSNLRKETNMSSQ